MYHIGTPPSLKLLFGLQHTDALSVHHLQVDLRPDMALICGFAKPLGRFGVVLRDTFAPFKHHSKVVLSNSMASFCTC